MAETRQSFQKIVGCFSIIGVLATVLTLVLAIFARFYPKEVVITVQNILLEATPVVSKAPTSFTPTETRPVIYSYVPFWLSMEPNCDVVIFEGDIRDILGRRISGAFVRVRFSSSEYRWIEGETYSMIGETCKVGLIKEGHWCVTPLTRDDFHTHITCLIDVVDSVESPAPLSRTVTIEFLGCGTAGHVVLDFSRIF